MKKILYITVCLVSILAVSNKVKAQQLGIFTNYLLNDYYYNPAVVGAKDVAIANLSYRRQWTGFTDAPVSYMGSVYGSVKNKRKVGLGGTIIGDKSGLLQRTGGYFTYAYHFDLTKKLRLGLGISAGFLQYRIKLYDVRVIDNGDDMLTGNVLSSNAFDANSGFYLYHEKFFVGVSGNQLLNYKLPFANSNSRLKPHMYGMAGYNFKFGSGKVKKNELQPSFMVREANNNVNIQGDLSLKYTYNKAFWIGAMYRTETAVCALVGFNYKDRFNVAYAYDYALNRINQYSMGTHEFWLSYTITKKKRSLSEEEEALDNSVQQLYKEQQLQQQKKKEEDEKK
ncbi:MAG: putative rane protein [Bacteroidetes bacterium]|jgi:type IX secretion system PorP/SprF family membrane protein|nr:putative rane protein [Bacteroidota bacterium]